MKLALQNNKAQSMSIFGWVLAAGGILISVGLIVYVIAILQDSDVGTDSTGNLTNAGIIYNDTLGMFTNFTAQLGPVGTLAGVFLIFGLLGIAGIGLYRASRDNDLF